MSREEFVLQYDEVFDGEPWYGASLFGGLLDIPLAFWNKKSNEKGRSISEYVSHLVNWRRFVIEKLNDNQTFDIALNTQADWGKEILINSQKELDAVLMELKETQQSICELVLLKTDDWLKDIVVGKKYDNGYMLRGILQHDIYHLGQLNLVYSQLKS